MEDASDQDTIALVDEIEYLIEWDDAGFETDWTCYDFEYLKLFVEWRKAEKQIENVRQIRQKAFIESHFKK